MDEAERTELRSKRWAWEERLLEMALDFQLETGLAPVSVKFEVNYELETATRGGWKILGLETTFKV